MIKEMMVNKKILVDNALECLLMPSDPAHDSLYASMQYSLMAGGKRIRPCLFLVLLDILGVDSNLYINVACALECVHTYSLIHDDLPGMDNDDYRRGKLANHKKYGVGIATMAGDGLLTYAFELLACENNISFFKRIALIKILTAAAGPAGMVGGQAHDKGAEGKTLSLSELMFLDQCKTGKLICASLDMASEIAGLSKNDKEAIHTYGKHIGLLFQITDDLLDFNGVFQEMGKVPLQDISEHKCTYVTLLGKHQAQQRARKEAVAAVQSLGAFGEEFKPLRELPEMILCRRK